MGKMFDFTGEVLIETDKALRMELEGIELWLPKSQIEYDEDPIIGIKLEVFVPEWLAEEEGLL